MRNSGGRSGGSSFDFSTLLGIMVGLGGVLGGLVLEGGNLSDIAQLTGAVIVFGGTLGAVMMTSPIDAFFRAIRNTKLLFLQPRFSPSALVEDLIEFGIRARKNGIVSLESDVDAIPDPFLRKALSLGVDGTDLEEIRKTMELEMQVEEQQGRAAAKVYEAAGGYAPTIGIIGAVLGLIQVMKHLDDISQVGHGIAVAFVATVYGVGAANLLFLPAANKLKSRIEQSMHAKELMLEGVCAIVQGLHPKVIERKLEAYLREEKSHSVPRGTREGRRGKERAA
jgi:chemotaxis protein MotA